MFKDKVLLITGGTGSFGNAVLDRFLGTDIKEIRIFSRYEKKQEFVIDKTTLTPMEFFSLVCIQEKELLYICTDIYNKYEKKKTDKPRYPLNNTFCILSSWRNLIERKYVNNLQDFDEYVFKNKNGMIL